MANMVLTQVYLEAQQKKALTTEAKKSGRKVSELMREAVDAAIAGVTLEDLKTLDEGTKRAHQNISGIRDDLNTNSSEHTAFMHQMAQLQKATKS